MIDLEQIHLWWKLFHYDNSPTEVRVIKSEGLNASGYYKDLNNIIRDINIYDKKEGWQIYFVLNEIDDACYTRKQCEHILERPTATTTDDNITARHWVFIDLDPKRPKEVSSSNEQLERARVKANEIYKFLKQQGFENMVVAMSGNGYHIQIPCSLSNTNENRELVTHFLEALQMLFEDNYTEVDQKPKNAARLCKLYGTTAKKGTNTAERPHRLSRILKYPDEIKPNKKEYFENVANLYKKETPPPSKENNWGREKFNVEDFLNKHGLSYKKKTIGQGTRYLLEECPFNSDHKHGDAMVFQHNGGALEFYCFHNSCSQYHWKDFRLHFEPDAYDKKDYQEFRAKQKYYEKYTLPKEPTELKAENAEDGKKWLSLRDIKTVKSMDKFYIHTGIYNLDRAIGGFCEGETTILSGINASGKTAILNQFLLNAVQQGVPSALWSGELPPDKLKAWLCQTAAGKQNVSKIPNRENSYEANDNVIKKIEDWLDEKLVIYNNNYGNNFEQIIADIITAIKKYGLKFIVLDNMMALSLEDLVGTQNEQQKKLMLRLDKVAKQYKVHILIVAHPRKEANFQLLRKESISGSSDLTNIAWNLLLIHRVGDDFEKRATEFWGKERTNKLILEGYNNIIEVAKNRDDGVVDFVVGLFYESESRRFKNSKAENLHYDWEERTEEYSLPSNAGITSPFAPNPAFDAPKQETETETQTQSVPQYDDDEFYMQQYDDSSLPF